MVTLLMAVTIGVSLAKTNIKSVFANLDTGTPSRELQSNPKQDQGIPIQTQTVQPEAALLLVRCLAFNLSPDAQDESLSQAEMLPAIGLLKEFFGELAATPLYEEAIATDRKWYRDRIALATRTILPPETIHLMNSKYLTGDASPGARDFAESLVTGNIDIKLAGRNDEMQKKISEAAERARARAANKNR